MHGIEHIERNHIRVEIEFNNINNNHNNGTVRHYNTLKQFECSKMSNF